MPERRDLLRLAGAGAATALAGCSGALRANKVPGGLRFISDRPQTVRVTVRALLKGGRVREEDTTPTPLGDTVTVAATFPIPGGQTVSATKFFPQPGTYVVEATAGPASATGRITLHRTLTGGLGADTVTIKLWRNGALTISVSDVD